jgi:DNA adenine methylase
MINEITSPPVRYTGSKWRISKWIIQHMPPHNLYLEPFCGGASVFFRKDPARVEILNDLEDDIPNFFKVLRDRTHELVRALTLTPFSRYELRTAHLPCEDELERARRFYVRSWQKFTGASQGHEGAWRYGKAHDRSPLDDWMRHEGLAKIANRLRKVYIESDTAINSIQRHDSAEALIFCDPPYVSATCTEDAYANSMTDADHAELAKCLHQIKGMAMISGYASELYRDLYADWKMVTTQAYTSKTIARTECLWISPKAQAKQMQRPLL